MSPDLVALLAGTVLAVGALAFVLYPLFFTVPERVRPVDADPRHADNSAILALREIEFDRATGKLSDADYAELKQQYSALALREIRGAPQPAGGTATPDPPLDAIEARVRALRLTHSECASCGVRPEPDAVYCSTCGAYLESACPACGAAVSEPGAAFCSGCGFTLSSARASSFV